MTDHPISIELLEEGHLLLLAMTGAGKTYQLRGFLERLRGADRRVGAVDKLGNHWGLTASADGKEPGLDFVIFGGKRAHVPMTPADGAELGRLFVSRNIPAIFDVSQWKSAEQLRWMEDFADAVFLHNDGALHLALDEAHSWVPQGGTGEAYASVLRLAEQGRGNGIRLMMAAPRLSRISKSAAGTASVVVAMRQTGTEDRAAMRRLLAANTDQMVQVEAELAGLPTGTGFVWDPVKATLERHCFPPNLTFDSSRTPRHGDAPPAAIAVSTELVDELRQLLARPALADYPDDVIPAESSAAWDKGGLVGSMLVERDARIAALETELAEQAAELERVGAVALEAELALLEYKALLREIEDRAGTLRLRDDAIARGEAPAATPSRPEPVAVRATKKPATVAPPSTFSPDGGAHPMATKIIIQLEEIAPARLTWRQLATMLNYSPEGGYFRAGKRDALASGRLVEDGDYVRAALTSGKALTRGGAMDLWSRVLGDLSGRIIDELDVAAGQMTKVKLADLLGYSPSGGFFRKGLALLRQNGVTIESGDQVRLANPLPGEQT